MITIELIQQYNFVLALLGIGAILLSVVLFYDSSRTRYLTTIMKRYGLLIAFLVTTLSAVLTLIYSEIFGFIPCGLCWFERIMLYPQVLILGTALYIKDRTMPYNGIVLSVFGFLISLYHHYIQMGGSAFVRCPTAGSGADCAKRFFFEFNFMTFPLLSAILFAFLIILYLSILRAKPNSFRLAD